MKMKPVDITEKSYLIAKLSLSNHERTLEQVRSALKQCESEQLFEACAGIKKAIDEYVKQINEK